MADYRSNCDHRECEGSGLSYNQVLDVIFNEESGSVDEPVTLDEAKDFCAIELTYAGNDAIVQSLIIAARQMCEKMSGIGFIERTVTAIVNNGNGGIFLPYGPIGNIDSLSIDDSQTPITGYNVQGVKWKQLLWPRAKRITVQYTGGYAAPLPDNLKTALLNAIKYLYDNRAMAIDNIGPIATMILKPLSRND